MLIHVQKEAFDPGALLNALEVGSGLTGGVVSFTGIVRADGGLCYMEIEHYPGMTEKALTEFAGQARDRWDLTDLLIIHRFGRLTPGEAIMMVATCAPHRRAAFEAADYLMDYLKSRAPFWKKEVTSEGESWVAAKAQDEQDLSRW